jgi:hypothetical protein
MKRYWPWMLGLFAVVAVAWYAWPATIGEGAQSIEGERVEHAAAASPGRAVAYAREARGVEDDDLGDAPAAGISGSVVEPAAPPALLRGDEAEGDFTSEESDRRADERVRGPHPMLTPEVLERIAAWQAHATQRGFSPAVLMAAIRDKIRASSGQPPSKEDFLSILPADLSAELDEIARSFPPPPQSPPAP